MSVPQIARGGDCALHFALVSLSVKGGAKLLGVTRIRIADVTPSRPISHAEKTCGPDRRFLA